MALNNSRCLTTVLHEFIHVLREERHLERLGEEEYTADGDTWERWLDGWVSRAGRSCATGCRCSAIMSSLTVKRNVRMMEHVTLTQKEQTRLQVLNSLMADHMTTEQAATLMGVSARHTRRILAAYSKEGAAALAHSHRGRRAPNATPEPLRSEVLRLAGSRYLETNHTHLNELLREREGIEIGRTALRRIWQAQAFRAHAPSTAQAPHSPAEDAP